LSGSVSPSSSSASRRFSIPASSGNQEADHKHGHHRRRPCAYDFAISGRRQRTAHSGRSRDLRRRLVAGSPSANCGVVKAKHGHTLHLKRELTK
jgi:hypothetical protein